MSLFNNNTAFKQQVANNFDIVNSFSELDVNRQVVLCDQLFHNQRASFKNTINILFPESSKSDAERLEKFLRKRLDK